MARLRLTTKQVNGGYYKGTRTGSMGYFAKNGEYMIDYRKVRTYVVPEDLSNFKVRYFQAHWRMVQFADLETAHSFCHEKDVANSEQVH